jgi:hypothetical protein
MNGSSARGLWSWIARAKSSLPVPDSPWSSTVAREAATVATTSMARRNASLSPTRVRRPRILTISRRNVSFCRRRRTTSSAWRTAISSVSAWIGLVR